MLHLTITRPERGSARIAFAGELDRSGVEGIAGLTSAIAPELQSVVFDLSRLRFVDIGGWRALDAIRAELLERGVEATYVDVPATAERVRELLEDLRPTA